MRLWTLSPKYLDQKGLVALWRESLLAQKVLRGETKGYRNHPQLIRFKNHPVPLAAIASYLAFIHEEAVIRGYNFNKEKICHEHTRLIIKVTRGQVLYEWNHLKEKLKVRDNKKYRENQNIITPEVNLIFEIITGDVEKWEMVKDYS